MMCSGVGAVSCPFVWVVADADEVVSLMVVYRRFGEGASKTLWACQETVLAKPDIPSVNKIDDRLPISSFAKASA